MKKVFYISIVCMLGFIIDISATMNLHAQTDTTATAPKSNWDINANGSLLLNQAMFSNWAQGGESSVSVTAYVSLFANYKNEKHEWKNTLNLGYGLMNSEEYSYYKKNEDKIDFQSKYGRKLREKMNLTAILSYKTQFTDSYSYPNDSVPISNFMAPAYLNASVGIDYKPIDGLSIFFTPASGRIIFVMDQQLADLGKYIPKPALYDTLGNKIKDGENIRFEFGATIVVQLEKEIMKNITVNSKLQLFNNYTDQNADNRLNIDVDWDTKVNFKVNDYISANIMFRMLYDHDTQLPIYKTVDGTKTQVGTGRRIQIKELLGIGFSYKL